MENHRNYNPMDMVDNDMMMNVHINYIPPPPPTQYPLTEEPKQIDPSLPPQISYEKINANYAEKKPKRKRTEHKPERREELLKDIAQEIYVRWKVKKMHDKYEKESRETEMKGEEVTSFNE